MPGRAVWLLVGLITLGRLVFLGWFSPFTLIEDEAHYWEWSLRLDWSYYSKGPGVAAAIAASRWLLDLISQVMPFDPRVDPELAVRLPAVLFSALGTLATAGLARSVFGDRRVELLAAVAYQAMPGVAISGLLMTIDGPMLACWAVAAWAAWVGCSGPLGSRSAWLGWSICGLALAVGFTFKYTAVLLIPGLMVGLWASHRPNLKPHLKTRPTPGSPPAQPAPSRQTSGPRPAGWAPVALGLGLATLGCVPVAVWNASRGWPTVRHLLGHLGVAGGDTATPGGGAGAGGWAYSPLWTLEVIGFFFAVTGGVGVLAIQGLLNTRRHGSDQARRGAGYLVACASGVGVFYLIVSVFSRTEANWVMPMGVTLAPLAAWAVADGRRRRDPGVRLAAWSTLISLACLLAAGPALALATGDATPQGPGRRLIGIPINRISGARGLADETARLIDDLRATTGLDPFVMTVHYGRASLLRFYLPGHPPVYSASALFGGRRSQHDLWPATDLSSPAVIAKLSGRPAVLFGAEGTPWAGCFERLEPLGSLASEPKTTRRTWLGVGFLGFDRCDSTPAPPPSEVEPRP